MKISICVLKVVRMRSETMMLPSSQNSLQSIIGSEKEGKTATPNLFFQNEMTNSSKQNMLKTLKF